MVRNRVLHTLKKISNINQSRTRERKTKSGRMAIQGGPTPWHTNTYSRSHNDATSGSCFASGADRSA